MYLLKNVFIKMEYFEKLKTITETIINENYLKRYNIRKFKQLILNEMNEIDFHPLNCLIKIDNII
jgi:predicted GIY-YIG superfamily endonuclease